MIPSVQCVNLDLHDRAEKAEAEAARLKELQPCGHPTSAIRSTPYIGNQHSNYCGWCADVEHERELSQAVTVELLAYREQVARLREALGGLKHCDGCYCEAAFSMLDGSHPRHSLECEAACDALDSSSGHSLRQHDAEVRAQERERCCEVIRKACGMCEGKGYVEAPDGERGGCEYCGRPIAAIRETPAE